MKAFVFDTETTGLVDNRTLKLERQPEIIEFYGCLVDLGKKGKIISEVDTLIKPKNPLTDKPVSGGKKTITDITGISNEMLKDAPRFKDVAKRIHDAITKAPLVIAHNASFDREMVQIEFERLKEKIKFPKIICTVEQTIYMKGYRLSLSALHQELFGEPFAGAHRAKVDVSALVRCCVELHKRKIL